MTREEASALWINYVRNELDETQRKEMAEFIESDPSAGEEFKSLEKLWGKMDGLTVPEPSELMDVKFQAMLTGYEMAQAKKLNLISSLHNLFQPLFESKMGLASLMLLIGLGAGYLITGGSTARELTSLNAEVNEMKKVMMLTLLEQPRATDRLKAVQISNEIEHPDEKVIDALSETLNNDTNVNVRLVSAQSLAAYAHIPRVRSVLIEAISNQTSPVIQNALADIMLGLQERNAVKELEKLLQEQNLDTLVKEKIRITIETLI